MLQLKCAKLVQLLGTVYITVLIGLDIITS